MENFLPTIRRAKIFEGFCDEEILATLTCLGASVRTFKRGAYLYAEGDAVETVGIIISGEIASQKTDFAGNSNIISRLFASDMIAAVAAYSQQKLSPFDLIAMCDTTVLQIDSASIIRPCCKSCQFHLRLIENMLKEIAERNIRISTKINILTQRTTRERILGYLHQQAKRHKSASFAIDLNRRQMADFLSTDRSALSRELSKMRNEGILTFTRNKFTLHRCEFCAQK